MSRMAGHCSRGGVAFVCRHPSANAAGSLLPRHCSSLDSAPATARPNAFHPAICTRATGATPSRKRWVATVASENAVAANEADDVFSSVSPGSAGGASGSSALSSSSSTNQRKQAPRQQGDSHGGGKGKSKGAGGAKKASLRQRANAAAEPGRAEEDVLFHIEGNAPGTAIERLASTVVHRTHREWATVMAIDGVRSMPWTTDISQRQAASVLIRANNKLRRVYWLLPYSDLALKDAVNSKPTPKVPTDLMRNPLQLHLLGFVPEGEAAGRGIGGAGEDSGSTSDAATNIKKAAEDKEDDCRDHRRVFQPILPDSAPRFRHKLYNWLSRTRDVSGRFLKAGCRLVDITVSDAALRVEAMKADAVGKYDAAGVVGRSDSEGGRREASGKQPQEMTGAARTVDENTGTASQRTSAENDGIQEQPMSEQLGASAISKEAQGGDPVAGSTTSGESAQAGERKANVAESEVCDIKTASAGAAAVAEPASPVAEEAQKGSERDTSSQTVEPGQGGRSASAKFFSDREEAARRVLQTAIPVSTSWSDRARILWQKLKVWPRGMQLNLCFESIAPEPQVGFRPIKISKQNRSRGSLSKETEPQMFWELVRIEDCCFDFDPEECRIFSPRPDQYEDAAHELAEHWLSWTSGSANKAPSGPGGEAVGTGGTGGSTGTTREPLRLLLHFPRERKSEWMEKFVVAANELLAARGGKEFCLRPMYLDFHRNLLPAHATIDRVSRTGADWGLGTGNPAKEKIHAVFFDLHPL